MTPERLVMLTEIKTSVSSGTATSVWRFHTTLSGAVPRRCLGMLYMHKCRGPNNHFQCACLCVTHPLAFLWLQCVCDPVRCTHPRLHASVQRVIPIHHCTSRNPLHLETTLQTFGRANLIVPFHGTKLNRLLGQSCCRRRGMTAGDLTATTFTLHLHIYTCRMRGWASKREI